PATTPLAPLRATRLSTPPVIDGALDDEAWTGAPLPTDKWLSYNPLHGDSVAQQTSVWVGYDNDALYFAFRCDDPEPSRIKTSITRRDNIWSDDWVGLSLDALGTGQPLQTIRFKGGSDVQMGILFWRRVSRIGVSVSWPALEPGKWVFQKHSKLAFADIAARPTREIIPSATFSRDQIRATPSDWGAADNHGALGLSVKGGLSDRKS